MKEGGRSTILKRDPKDPKSSLMRNNKSQGK